MSPISECFACRCGTRFASADLVSGMADRAAFHERHMEVVRLHSGGCTMTAGPAPEVGEAINRLMRALNALAQTTLSVTQVSAQLLVAEAVELLEGIEA